MIRMKKLNDKKITVGTITKKNPSTMIAAATTITPVLASAARILGVGSQQKLERKGIVNKKDLSLLFGWNYDRNGWNSAFSSCIARPRRSGWNNTFTSRTRCIDCGL